MAEEYKYKEMTHKIIGAAMQVHKTLGNGFQEVIYQRAMEIEMPLYGLNFNREFEMPSGIANSKLEPAGLISWWRMWFQLN